jgi:thiol-disulfide isomerase/thioredoxin
VGWAAVLLAASLSCQAVELGAAAPGFRLPALDSNSQVSLADYRGKVVFVDFWASWCGPCRQSLPLYDKLRESYPAADFAILAISLDEDAADAKAFLVEHSVKYKTLLNSTGDVAKAFDLKGMPSSYLIDRDGVVRARHVGFEAKDIDALKKEIDGLLKIPAHAS